MVSFGICCLMFRWIGCLTNRLSKKYKDVSFGSLLGRNITCFGCLDGWLVGWLHVGGLNRCVFNCLVGLVG